MQSRVLALAEVTTNEFREAVRELGAAGVLPQAKVGDASELKFSLQCSALAFALHAVAGSQVPYTKLFAASWALPPFMPLLALRTSAFQGLQLHAP